MSRLSCVLACIALAGCANLPAQIREIEIPVAVRCKVVYPVKAASCFDALAANALVFESVKCLLIDREHSLAYEAELQAALRACADP